MDKNLLSIVTPCFNGANFVHRLLDSILLQTYASIEMFVIDDGSTDNSALIIKSYIPKFETRGYKLTYIYQENSGQSVALDKGIKLINGEFFTWPDSDDYYAQQDSLEKMIRTLKQSDDSVGAVRCFSHLATEESCEIIGKMGCYTGKTDLFLDCLFNAKDYWWPPINFMVKANALKHTIPSLSIYTSKKAGQNWQLLLPILRAYKCLTICEYLHVVTVRKDSHSRGQFTTLEDNINKVRAYENTILHTLQNIVNISEVELQNLCAQIKRKYFFIRLRIRLIACIPSPILQALRRKKYD